MTTNLEDWKMLSIATVSDALDGLTINGQCFGIKALNPAIKIAGRASTVKMISVSTVKGSVGDYIDDVPDGNVVVIDNNGREDVTVWGDLLTTVASRRGIAGTVINGVCRDSSRIRELNYPIFSRGVYMRTGKDRVQAENFDVPVLLGQVRVEPGDLIIGDDDGVLVIPQSKEKKVLHTALLINEAEEKIRTAILNGTRLDTARREFNYFQLQRDKNNE
jgi:4-hydroxy-4-methyl-2-oxoglutarate aldolase